MRPSVAVLLVIGGAAIATLTLISDAYVAIAAVLGVSAVIYGLAGLDIDGEGDEEH